MVRDFIITGDLHGDITPIENIFKDFDKEKYALVILGDAGFNFYLNKTDQKKKEKIQSMGCLIYCVRGNHEERPENLNMDIGWDYFVSGPVYYEEQFPNIRYLLDGVLYDFIFKYKVLVIGGAYSVDKEYRLIRAKAAGYTNWTGWFKDEQLSKEEMNEISRITKGRTYDFILSHTCPRSWEPWDLFLSQVDQKKIDKSMENWLDDLRLNIKWNYAWLFGHFHDDRIVRPHVEMFYKKSELLSDIAKRWEDWDNGYKLPWWLKLDPNYSFWSEELCKRKEKENLEKIWIETENLNQ